MQGITCLGWTSYGIIRMLCRQRQIINLFSHGLLLAYGIMILFVVKDSLCICGVMLITVVSCCIFFLAVSSLHCHCLCHSSYILNVFRSVWLCSSRQNNDAFLKSQMCLSFRV